jgi:[amino group carrier protein]-L-2-aminoadipate 6-kinase
MMIVKIGGGAAINLAAIAEDLAGIAGPVVVVHGANALRDELACALGRPTRVVTSASGTASVLSDDDAIDVLLAAYAGIRNKRLVEHLQQRGINAVGLTGLDGRLIQGRRNAGIRVRDGGKVMLLRDHSGKPVSTNVTLLRFLLEQRFVPVLTVPIADENGLAINADNDDIVAVLARDLGAAQVVQLIEAPGMLADSADPSSVIARLSRTEIESWVARADGRFKRKLIGLEKLGALDGVSVVVADGRAAHPLADALAGKGTVIA